MATNEELRPSKRPAIAGHVWLFALLALVAGAASALVAATTLRHEAPTVEFLEQALGTPNRTAPLQRSLPTGERFRIRDRALVAEADFGSVALEPIGLARGAGWSRTEHGVTRRTPFGSRTLVLDGTQAEEFLTVERRQGTRTWRWQLDTNLDPKSRVDGRVALVDRRTGGTFEIAPVRILDAGGDDITPVGLRWTVRGHRLELTLDDRELPLPYVIDPAITVITPNGTHATTSTASLSLAKPTGALVSGSTILVAHVSKRNDDAVSATGWTSIGQTCNGTTVCTDLLWKKFAGETGPYAFTWTNGVGAGGGIVALANVWQPGSRSPVDSTVGASGTGTTANPGSLTSLFTALGEMAVGGFGAQGTTPGVPTGKTDAGSAAITSGAQGNRIGVRTATLNETAGTISNWNSTLSSAAWSAQLAGFIPRATDGSGTLTTATTNVAASSTGNTIAFTYTPNAGLDNGSVSVQVPAGWTAPQTGAGNGQITVSGGTGTNNITITGSGPWTVRVDNVQIADDGAGGVETLTITYNTGTATATTGAQTWQAQSRGISTGTMTNLASSPSITVRAANGSGTMSSSVSNVANGATSQTVTFTYTAATGGMSSGAVTVDVPAGWTAPNTTAGTAGYTIASTGTVSTSGQTITVTGVTLAAAATMTITYGSGAGGGATATTTAGPATWQVQQRSVTPGTLTNLGSSPSINVYDANNAGSISQTAGPANVTRGAAIGSAITWTFTAGAGGMSGGSLGITVPAGWSAPRTTAGAGYTVVSTGTLGVSGQQIQVTGLTLAAGATMTLTYGSGGGANLPVSGTTSGANTFGVVKHSTAGIGSAVATTSQPATINVYAADGSGTIGVAPTSAVAGSTGNTLTFTYTAATGGIGAGTVELTVPAAWTAPQTGSSTSAGYTTASGGSGTNAIAWNGGTRKLTISGVTLAASASLTVTYGANAGSGGGATAPTSTGAATTWTTQQKSTSGGTLTSVGASPTVTVTHGALADFLVEASGGGAIGTQTAGSGFTIRVTARDAYGNTVTSFNGAGNTVDITSTGTLSAGGGTTGTFSSGVLASHGVTITTSGSRTITATRTSGGSQSGTSSSFTVNPAAASSLDVVAPATATAGTPFSVTVTARDTYNNVATGYLGTVAFSGGGAGAQLPSNYAFVGGDAGTKTFATVELRQAGSRTVTVTDTVTGSITGNDTVTVNPGAASLTTSTLSASPTSIVANGSSTSTITLRLEDAYGNDLTAGDGATYAFATDHGSIGSATNNGDGSYSATLTSSTSAGVANVTASRNAASFSNSTSVTFTPGAAVVLDVSAPATATAGSPFSVTVTAKDANGNTVTGYLGTVAFSGGGTGAQLPSNYTFVGGDAGTKTFATVELRQAGSRTVIVTDTVTGSITGNDTVTVNAAGAATLDVVAPATGITGQSFSATVTAKDAYANVATGYLGTVAFSTGGGGGTAPGNYTFVAGDNGSKSVSGFSFSTPGSKSVIATDTVTGTITGSGSVTIDPAGASLATSTFGASPTSIVANGSSTSAITLQLKDALGNDLTVGDGASYGFTTSRGSVGSATDNGDGTISATLTSSTSAGVATVSATRDGSPFANSVAVTFTPGPAATLDVAAPASATAGSSFSVDVTARDAFGNVATGYAGTVAFSGGGTGAQLPGNYAFVPGDAGTKTFTVELRQAGARTVTATDTVTGTITGNDTVTVGHGTASQIALSGATTNLTSGASRVLTATIQDSWGNTVTSDSSTVVAFAKASGAGTVTGTGNATASSGIATKTVTGALGGSVTMEATSAGLTTGTLGAFTVVHGAATQIALTGSTANLASGGTRVLTATLQDAAGNTVTSDNSTVVSFAKASGAGTVTGTGNATASSGVATKTVTGALGGSVTMEATAAGLTTGTLGAFTVVHGAAADILLTGSTANLTSGAARVLTATIRDAAGNTVTSDNSTVVAFAQASGAGSVTGTGNATASSGVATKTITAALGGSVTMEATATGLTTGTLGAFTVVHGAAAQIALSGSTTNLASGSTRVLTAAIQDAAGNTVTSDNSTVVTFAKQSGAGTVTGTGNATASSGVATKTITGAIAGSVTMEATSAGLTTGTLGAFTVVHGGAAQIALTGSTADLTSGATRVLTATIQDAAGNTVTSDNSTVVAFAKASGAGTITGTGNATASAGVATKTITGAVAGSVTMEATAAGLTTGTLAAFTVVHGAAAQIAVSGSTADLTSGATRVLTATLQDAAGNTVMSDNSTVVAFAKASGAGTVTGTGNATVSAGVATKTVTGALVGSVTMEATATGLTTGSLAAFTVVHGAAAQIQLTGSTADLTSGATRVLTATIQDAAGNTVTSDSSTVVSFAKASGAGSVTGTGNASAASGIATMTVTGALAGSVIMEASAAGLTTGTLGAFTVVHGAAAQIQLTGSTADLTSGATRVLTATIEDAAGNTVTADNSTVVAFAKASGAGTVTGTGNATATAGVATKTITGAVAGSVTMEASAAGLTTGTLAAFTVVHGAAAQIQLTGSTADLTSGATRVLTATIVDAAGNTVTSDNSTVVAFAKASGAGTITGTGNATASGGVATKTITGAVAGSVTMEASAAGLTTGTLAAFTVVHGAAAQIQLTGSTADLTSGATRVLTATIVDAAGNTVTSDNSTVVAFAKASGAGTITGTGNATASAGVATKTITGAVAGSVTMEATAAGLTTGTLAAFTVVHGSAARIALTHSGSVASGDNNTLTATIQDAAGNTVTSDNSTVVAFAQIGGPGTVTGLGNATASAGVASKVVVNATSGQIDFDAQAAGLTTGTTSYVVGAGTASTLTSTITASPTSIVANGSSTSTITVRLKDAAGNDLSGSGGTVALGLTGTGSLSAVTDNADGTYSATLTSPTAVGGGTVTGTLNAAALAASAGVTYTHGPAAQIVLTESGSTVAGNGHTLTATIEDANGNTVTSDNVTVVGFAKTGGAGTVTGLGNATASAGVATKAVTNRLAGQIDLDAQAAGLTTGTAGYTIAIGPVSTAASDSTVAAAPAAVYANGVDTATITVTLRDAGGNGVAGKTVTLAQGAGSSTITGGGATNASGVVTFSASDPGVETVTYTATDTTDSLTLDDDATVDFTFADATAPTNTITLGSATRAWLTGTTLFYNGAAGGSFTLSSAVADGGAGPASADYPAVVQAGWSHGGENVSTPAGGPYVSSTFTFGAGSTGNFGYGVTANDAWTPANSTLTTLNVTEDSTAPSGGMLCNGVACSAGWYTASPVSVALAAPDAGVGLDQIRYTTDGTDPTIFTGTVYAGAFTVAAEGITTVKYRAFDRIGNDTGVLTRTVRIDTVAPGTTIDSAPAAATQDTTPTFAFSSPEAGSTFQVRIDGGAWTTQTSPLTLGPLAESTYTFEVRATDVAGNVDASPASFTFTVDTSPANTTIISAPPAASSSTGATFSFTASDAGPGFECRIDGGAFADCSSPTSYSGLAEAAHTFEVRAEDTAGNVDQTPATHAWTIDLTAPNTSFLSTPANPSANTTPTFGLGSTEPGSTFECDLDGGGWSPCATPLTTPALADGSHTLKARATDAAGNTDASESTSTWLVDATAPTGSITSPANGADVGGTIALASNSADPGGSGVATVAFQRSPAGTGTWTAQASSWDTTAQSDGDYDLRVLTTDGAGNTFTSPTITVTIDNTDPALSVVAPNPVNLATADPAVVSAAATDDGSGIANVRFDQCAEDSPACVSDSWVLLGLDTGAPYQASWPIPSDGPRLLRVRATDNAGKQKTELVLITIDRIRPSGSLTAPVAAANLRGAAVALAATASDTAPGTVNTVTFQSSPAGAGTWTDVATDATAPYTGSLDTTALTDGLHDLRVFTTDAAGNAEAAPATIQVRVDNTAPTGTVTAPAAGANVRGTIAITSNSADAGGSGVATVQFQRSPAGAGTWTNQGAGFDTTAVADGQYDIRVTTTDNAGNTFTSAAITIRVDNTLPTGTVTAPAAGANVRGTIAITSNSADAGGSGVATVQFRRSPAGAGTWTNQGAGFDTTAVADGQYDIRVTTTDNAGNTFTSAAITIRVDNTLPTGTVTAPANGAEIGVAPVTLTSNSADAGGSGVATVGFERSPAGTGTWTATAASWNTASGPDAVADGSYDLRVKTTDNAGNVFTSAAITVLVDHTAATTSASLAPASPSNAPVTVSFSASDGTGSGISVISYRIDGGSLQQGAAVVVSAPGDHSNDGAHLVEYFATDEVGNVESPKSVTVVIDTTAPSGSGGDPGDYLRGIANLSYSTAAGDVSSVQFQFSPAGAGAWTNVGAADIAPPYEASWNTTLVADGPYDLRAVVTDATGNVANTLLPGLPKTVDNTAPSGSVTAPVAAAYVSGTIAVDASASDGGVPAASGVSAVRFEVKPSGAGAFSVFGTQTAPVVGSTYRQPLGTTALADGPADLRVVVTDVAGNETTSAVSTVNVDNDAPVVTLGDPGAAVGASVALTASSSADTADVSFRYRPVGTTGAGTAIGSDNTAPFGVTWTTAPAAEQQWELIAVATDGGGNVTTSAPRVVLVDRTQPTGSVTAPVSGANVGGPAVVLAASAADAGGSGVTLVEWQVKEFGSGGFTTVASDATAPFDGSWNSTPAPDGATEIRALITDAAGNVRTTAVVPVTVDSTGPSVTLTDPGAVLSGTVALAATTGGGAARVAFSVSPADANVWTQIGEDTTAPFGLPFDTAALADGLYDLRAIGYDGLGNPSAPSVREDVRLDNTAPQLVSATPADGSVSASASQIVLTASEPVTAPGALLDAAAAPAPAIVGNQLTFSTGALADGLHVLEGELQDASGTRIPFRVAVTIESSVGADRPPVELSARPGGVSTLVAPGGLAAATVPAAAWPSLPTADDFMVIRVDLAPPAPVLGMGLLAGTQLVEVTAHWALAGTPVTSFDAPIEILIPNPSGEPTLPATSQDGTTWRTLPALGGTTLPSGRQDGWYRDGAGVHILTRHLTWYALVRDGEAPTEPRDLAGVVADDGLTLRWAPGSDASGQLGNVILLVNGESYREFGPTEFEAKLGAFEAGDTRSFTLVQKDAAGNVSRQTAPLRALPVLAGMTLAEATAALGAAGFDVGNVAESTTALAVPGTVVEPTGVQLALTSSRVDLVVAKGGPAPQTRLSFSVAGAQRVALRKDRTIAVRIKVSKPAQVTVLLRDAKQRRLHSWKLNAKPGANVVKLRLPANVRRPGTYWLTWIARSGGETISRTIKVSLVGLGAVRPRPKSDELEIVLAGETPPGNALAPGKAGMPRRVSSVPDADHAFDLLSTPRRRISAVVVDADEYGTLFIADVHAVFPSVPVIAISREPARRAQAMRAGAVVALPRNASAAQLAKAIVRAAGR